MADLLRGTTPFKPFSAALEVSLVEISPVLRQVVASEGRTCAPACISSGTLPVPWLATPGC